MDRTLRAVLTDALVAVNRSPGEPRTKKTGGLSVDSSTHVWLVLLRVFIGFMFTVRNAVLVALMQVGVIVAGVLLVAASRPRFDDMNCPPSIYWVAVYGPVALVVPLLWILIVMVLRQRPGVTERARKRAFYSGIIIVLVLGLGIAGAIIVPAFNARLDWSEAQQK